MKLHILLCCVILLLAGQALYAARAEFTISISTNDTTLPPGENVPYKTERSLVFTLHSPQDALPTALAEVWLPESLGFGKKVALAVGSAAPPADPAEIPSPEALKMKLYWGSSQAVRPGQPKLITWKDFPDSIKKAMKPSAKPVSGSTAKWAADVRKLQANVKLAGQYQMMSYAGNGDITLDAQEFLPPVEVITLGASLKAAEPILVEWKQVPGALAYFVTAHGVAANQTIIGWTSGESMDAAKSAAVEEYLSDKQLQSLLTKGVLLGPNTTRCTIPAGAFQGSDGVMVVVTAYGRDKEASTKQVTARAVVRSTATIVRSTHPDISGLGDYPNRKPMESPYPEAGKE